MTGQAKPVFAFLMLRALAAFGLALTLASCGGGGGGGDSDSNGGGAGLAPELFGSWDVVEIEVFTMRAACPAEIGVAPGEAVSCGTTVVAFNADGTYVSIDTTDEFGNPFDERIEGTWSTTGNTLTITETMEGPDAGNLMPIDPPDVITLTWSVSGNTLTATLDDPFLPGPVTLRLVRR